MHQCIHSIWETEFALIWATQLEGLNTNWVGGLRRILLQLSWFHQDWMHLISRWSARCYHSLPFGPPLLSHFQLLVFFLFFLERRWRGLWGGKRWSDLIHIKSGLTEDNSSSDFLLIRLWAAQQKSRARGAHRPDNRQSESATGQAEIMLRLCHASIWVVVLSWNKAAHVHITKTQCSMHEHSNTKWILQNCSSSSALYCDTSEPMFSSI